ncbi:acyltransferase [Hymenobacter tibetensis]|uniref:Acyltransferase n=1 Tax=Hymenobacter tibetensis TaxID=497967 RepID=A0ABY4D4C7_9BACT|nr:acyltransferase [Hymenobacter tibetensis]UOG76016.1 acyltransferase [Hymenobacter tibetensis]
MSVLTSTSSKTVEHLSYQELDILHSLRGFCAFYVVIFHAKFILWSGGNQYLQMHPRATWQILDYILFGLDMFSAAGYEMVIFFFTLSGFFIRYAQLRKHRRPIAFYINRIVRIYPPYLFSVLLACGVLLALGILAPEALTGAPERELNPALQEARQQLLNFHLSDLLLVVGFLKNNEFYTGYNEVYWSLLPEALFYLGVPLFFWRIKWYYIISVLIYVFNLFNSSLVIDNAIVNYMLTYNFYFAIGVALYDLVIFTEWLRWVRRVSSKLLFVVAVMLFGLMLVAAVTKLKPLSGTLAAILAFLSISSLLAGKVSPKNWLVRATHSIGIYSFSLYLYHFPLLILCYAGLVWLTGDLVIYARYYWLAVPLVTMLSYALYLVTERASVNYFRKV